MIYLDYSAHTPTDPRVLERFCEYERQYIGNANSTHAAGKAANAALSYITESIASLLAALPEEIIYTSGASESNNLAIKGIARTSRHEGRHIIATPLEHASVSAPLTYLQEHGYEIDLLDIGRDGKIDLDHLRELLRDDTVLLCVSAVDSELGTVQPIGEIAEILKGYPHCRFHVDATQAIGKIAFPLDGVDTASMSAHKFYGICGVGILYRRREIIIEPLIHGGVSTTLYRSGTPALSLAAAFESALSLAVAEREERFEIVRAHNSTLRRAFASYAHVRINSPEGAVPHILNVSVDGIKAADFQSALDRRGVCVSVKSACSVDGTPSRAVYAVSRDRKNARSSWRISISHMTTGAEIAGFLEAFDGCYRELLT